MSRAGLIQKLKDLIVVTSIVVLTGCAGDPLAIGPGGVNREAAQVKAPAAREVELPNFWKIPDRK